MSYYAGCNNYQLPTPCSVLLAIYNINGRLVETLVDDFQDAGQYVKQWNATGYSSGVYFYRLVAGDYTDTHKMVLLK